MENYILENDLSVFYVKADSFPQGINTAIETLHSKVNNYTERITYGISRPNSKGVIEYKAGFEEKFEGEGTDLGCETLLLKKGNYSSILVKNYTSRIESISEAFQNILPQNGLDPEGYCIEVYQNSSDVLCMVRMSTTLK